MNIDLTKLMSQDQNSQPPLNIKKYLSYLLKKKHWILVCAVIFSILSAVLTPIVLKMTQKFTTSAVIRFDDPRLSKGISAVTDFSAGMETISKASLFVSNSFLESVVDSLKLNLILSTREVRRTKLFNKIEIKPDASKGTYTFKKNNNAYAVYFKDGITKKTKLIQNYDKVSKTDLIFNKQGLRLVINSTELKKFDEIEFDVISVLKAANFIKEKNHLSYDLDRTRTLMTISYEHSDPEFAPYVTNKVSDMFIKKLLEYKRFQTRSILETLDEQLKVAQSELSESEEELRQFREKNPKVFLSQGRETLIGDLAANETQLQDIKNSQSSITQMKQKLNESNSPESRHFVFLEIMSFLENQNVAGAKLLSQRYQALINIKDKLVSENYNSDHPLFQSNQNQIMQLQDEIAARLNEYQRKLITTSNESKQNIYSGQSTLKSLPRNEMKLAELQRNRQIKENILSNIMVRYNEAKVADAAVIPDAYIVDRATRPIVEPIGILGIIKFSGIGFFVGILFGILLVITLVFVDRKIWSSKEVQEKVKLPILALIPNIETDKYNNGFKNNETIDPKLVTSDYAPTLAGETFRKLRTLIGMRLGQEDKLLIVGSLFPNEGKSLIAANLAIAFAQQKKKTILIDCDLRRGVQHSTFAKNKTPGFTNIIVKRNEIDTKLITNYIQDTHVPNLFLLSSGDPIPNPSESLGSPQMEKIIKILENKFDLILFDSPPFGLSPDLMVMARYTKNILLTLRAGSTNLSQFKSTLDEFGDIRKSIFGLVINSSDEVIKGRKYQYSYYQY